MVYSLAELGCKDSVYVIYILITGSLQRWLLSKPVKAAVALETEKMAGLRGNEYTHKELEASR